MVLMYAHSGTHDFRPPISTSNRISFSGHLDSEELILSPETSKSHGREESLQSLPSNTGAGEEWCWNGEPRWPHTVDRLDANVIDGADLQQPGAAAESPYTTPRLVSNRTISEQRSHSSCHAFLSQLDLLYREHA